MITVEKVGYILAVSGVALVFIWIGFFKFTPTEAKEIRPMVANSPLMSWLYNFFSKANVSKLVGSIEIVTGTLLIVALIFPKVGLVAGTLSTLTFIVTISFIFTTPNSIEKIDGFWLPDTFILKDVMALGISLLVIGKSFSEV